MLVMSRKLYERVRLDLGGGRFIWVSLQNIQRDKVRLGFDAPRDIQILREEIIPFRELEPEDG